MIVEGDTGEEKTLVKATSANTYITYSNIYCAMCHGETMLDLRYWNFQLACVNVTFGDPAPVGDVSNKSLSDVGE